MKTIWQSKTFWFNFLTVLIATVGSITNVFTLNEQALKILGLVVTIGNIILRTITSKSIGTSETTNK